MKMAGIIIGIIVLILIIVGVGFMLRLRQMVKTINSVAIQTIDLNAIADGEYTGEFGAFVVRAQCKVTVKDHAIQSVSMVKQSCGKGYEALQTMDLITQAQSPKVDVVSGATASSKCIMIAVQNALKGPGK